MGMRVALSKSALTAGVEQMKEQIREQEERTPEPKQVKPSAMDYAPHCLQTCHGPIEPAADVTAAEPVAQPEYTPLFSFTGNSARELVQEANTSEHEEQRYTVFESLHQSAPL